MYRLTEDPGAVLRDDGTLIPAGHRWWADYQTWLAAGNQPFPAQTKEQAEQDLTRSFENGIQDHMDAAAHARGYDSIATAVSYAEEPAVPRFQDDGKAFRAWRSRVWAYAYQELAKVKAGEREIPTLDAFLAELPALPDQAAA